MNAKKIRTSGWVGEMCYWYPFGLDNNVPRPAYFLQDCPSGNGAMLCTLDEHGTETMRAVKHMSMEVADNDRRRNGGWSFERVDIERKRKAQLEREASQNGK